MDLQGIIINKKFIMKEVAMLKGNRSHTLHFYEFPWKFFKIRQILRFLVECLSSLRWEDGMISHNEAKRLTTTAVFEHDAIMYVKGREK